MLRHSSIFVVLVFLLTAFPSGAAHDAGGHSLQYQEVEELLKGFAEPPGEYRPQVWWHWMNGNVTRDGIRKDLEWMDRSGISGFHVFDAGFDTPQIVEKRIPYMTDEWKAVFNYALDLADSLGMEVSVASSPGWSVTGGPWVSREDAMKKLVWSETVFDGGRRIACHLPGPSAVCGPYQNYRRYRDESNRYDYYRDVAVVAVRMDDADRTMEDLGVRVTLSDGTPADDLTDGVLDECHRVTPLPGECSWVLFEFPEPCTVKSYLASVDPVDRSNYSRCLECSDDGIVFRTVSSHAPETITPVGIYDIPATTARYFRFRANEPGRPLSYCELRLFGVTKVNAATEKAGFFASYTVRDFYQTPEAPDAVRAEDVVDLTGRFRDGVLNWKAPAGRWRIYRFGYSLTGKCNGPASPEATGLEVDKLDRAAVERYYRNYLSMYDEASGGRLGSVIKGLMIDSYEAGCQNWTPSMPEEFERRRGYSLTCWLPALAGQVIESAVQTERFLYDWRHTLEELMAECHYDAVDGMLSGYGMKRHTEAQEYSRVYNADGMDVRRNADIPMASFWMREFYSSYPCEEADMREAASVAHIYGQNVCASESFTTNGEDPNCFGDRIAWTLHPGNLKPAADAAMASGLNRFIIHSCVHQPVDDRIPGLTLSKHGMCFNRHNTWADEARTWTDYLSRSSYLLSQGTFAGDVAVFYGETTNAVARFKHERPYVPPGHSYDFVNGTVIRDMLRTEGSRLVTDSGMSYSMLIIDREVRNVTMGTLRRLDEFAKAGVLIVGEEPVDYCDLAGDGEEFRALVRDIWHAGRSNVISISQLPGVLRGMSLPADVAFDNPFGSDLRFVHRHLECGELYWLANISPEARRLDVSFNVTGRRPLVLHPDSGLVEKVCCREENGRALVSLDMSENDALFVLFTELDEDSIPECVRPVRVECCDASAADRIVPQDKVCSRVDPNMLSGGEGIVDPMILDGPWDVSFQPGRGAPDSIRLQKPGRLDSQESSGVRYYSGTATYSTAFRCEADPSASGYLLDLGKVYNMARVILNGHDLGLAWKAPFRLDVGNALRQGDNILEIRVTNTWRNRIVGDLQADCDTPVTYTTYRFYEADTPLKPSGLEGPVKIIKIY